VTIYSELPHITVSVPGVRTLLEAIKPHKDTGPDGIPARLLKDDAAELATVLSHIYQASLNQGRVLADWKHTWVIPVFKKGARNSPSNYRPISITSIACKTLEPVIHSNLSLNGPHGTSQHPMGSVNVDLVRRNSFKLLTTCELP